MVLARFLVFGGPATSLVVVVTATPGALGDAAGAEAFIRRSASDLCRSWLCLVVVVGLTGLVGS